MASSDYCRTNDLNSMLRGGGGGFDHYDRKQRLSGWSEIPTIMELARGLQGNQYELCGERNTYPRMHPGQHPRPGLVCCFDPYCRVHRSYLKTYDSVEILKPLPKQPPIKLDELNFNCLEEIVKLLDGSSIRALAQVNHELRIALSNMNLSGGRQPPYLMPSESSDSETSRFLRLEDNRIIALPLPAARGKRVLGSPHGQIVTMDLTLPQFHLLNIFSQVQVSLPPFPMIDDNAWLDWFLNVQKCLVFKIFPPEFLVVIILHPANFLYLTKPRKIQEWVSLRNPKKYVFRDVALFQGQVYALCDNGSIVKITFHESDLTATATHLDVSKLEDKTAERSYLVASPDDLYGVFQYDEEDGGWTPFRVSKLKFKVYKLNFDSLRWEPVLSIGNYAFFVGGGNSLCFSPVSSNNYRRNCIYFTNEDSLNFPNRFVYGIFELGTRRPDLRRVNGEGAPLPHSCPTWIAYDLTPPNFRN